MSSSRDASRTSPNDLKLSGVRTITHPQYSVTSPVHRIRCKQRR